MDLLDDPVEFLESLRVVWVGVIPDPFKARLNALALIIAEKCGRRERGGNCLAGLLDPYP